MFGATKPNTSLRFLVPAALVICGAIFLIAGFDRQHLQSWLNGLGIWAPVAFVFLGIVLMSILLPKTIVSITAGALFGTYLGGCLMLVIAVSAAACNYSIGRWWLSDSIRRRLDTSADTAGWAHAIRDVAAEAGFGFHALIRLAPVPSMLISYCMGAVRAKIIPFMSAALLGVIPQLLWVHGGSIAQAGPSTADGPYRWLGPAVSIIAGITVGIVVPREAMRRIRERQIANG